MADDQLDPRALPAVATQIVHDSLFMLGLDDPVLGEPLSIVRSGSHFNEAAERLKTWFTERLTIDPGVPGPFGDLAYDLISTMLDFVDWQAIVRVLRVRED